MGLIIDSFGKGNKEEIELLERQFNIVIPEDYKNFLLQHNGGTTTNYLHNELIIKEINESITIEIMYGVNTGIKNADIEQWTSEYQEDLFQKSMIIGSTIQHGFIVYLLSNDEYRGIYYYDDSYEFESSSDIENTYYLSSTFTEFLSLFSNE